ncbi:MAG: hypothetical protein LBB79_01045 [Prevotellaceae bacterium]|nr:hypothetical protein [Prevotellaceae bacterium]
MVALYSKTLAEIDAEFEQRQKSVATDVERSKQLVVELFENCKFSPNSVVDFDKILLDDETAYQLPYALRIGNLEPKHSDTKNVYIPAVLPFNQSNAVAFLIDNEQNNEDTVQRIFQLIAFRFMMSLPINLCKFHFVDTLSFGKKVNIMNRLSEKIMSNAIINDEKRLEEFVKELEQSVIDINRSQLIRYGSLEEFNREAGHLAVPYRFVFISNFPHGFSKELADRFYKLINNCNASKAGIFVFYSIDNSVAVPHGFDVSEFINVSTFVYPNENGDYEIENTVFDKPFNDAFNIRVQTELPYNLDSVIEAINRKADNVKAPVISLDSYIENLMRTQKYWQADSRRGIKIPVGKRPVDETVYFELDGDTNDYFAMVGGRPGYGKTVLLHNIICNASILYSPLELNFYLIDCTNGTGFKPYDKLPHAVFVSITSQREYTLSALEHLINEMYRRAELFKNAVEKHGSIVADTEGYRRQTGEILPRLLVIIDEFQVLLESGDKISRKAGADLEKIVREGRKYGIHLVLCTQSYRNLDFNTDLITLRIAFNLKEYDSIKVLGGSDEDAAKLTRKGEAIMINTRNHERHKIQFRGAYTGRMLDYVAFCNEKLNELPDYPHHRFVFDGKLNSDISANQEFMSMLSSKPKGKRKSPQPAKVYIGAPSFIRSEHIYFKIKNSPCSNLLIVGNDINAAMSTLMLANYQLAKQSLPDSQFCIVDFLGADDERSKYFLEICERQDNVIYCKKQGIAGLADKIEQELNIRAENEKNGVSNADKGRIVLTLSYIQNAKELKKEGYKSSPITDKLVKILKNGADLGIHIFVYSYHFKGFEEVFDRMLLNEFENRIVLAEGGGTGILTEQATEPKEKGYGLIQTDGETAAIYNPAPFMFYNRFDAKSANKDSEILKRIFSIYNEK